MSDSASGNKNYAGQRDYTSATSPYNSIEYAFRVLANGLCTATLVQVVAVHPGSGLLQGTVDVQLLINQQDALGNTTPHGILYGLPYSRVQAGASALIIDPVVKDIGVAVFSSRDISSVIANTSKLAAGSVKTVNPGSARTYDYSDGLYLFTALSATQPTDYIKISPSGGLTVADRFGNGIVTASNGITINGILFPIGGISFDIKTHTHDQGDDSHGDTEVPTNAPNGGS